jgi:hypothetical protein
VHYVDGDVRINTSSALLNGVTIVATGKITISSSAVSLTPYAADLPSLFSGYDRCKKAGVVVRASAIDFTGAVYSPTAEVQLAASLVSSTDGALVGSSVNVSGSQVALNVSAP